MEEDEDYPDGYAGRWWISAELAHRVPDQELRAMEAIGYYFGEYHNFAGPAVASTAYGLVAVALAEATKGRIASWDGAFEDGAHQGDTAAEFAEWWGNRQITFYTRLSDSAEGGGREPECSERRR